MFLKIVEIDNEQHEVANFVKEHPYGNIFQSLDFYKIHKDTKNHYPFCYLALNDNNDILGIVSGVIEKNYFWPINTFTSTTIEHMNMRLHYNIVDVVFIGVSYF